MKNVLWQMPIMADQIERRQTADNLECDVTGQAVLTKTDFRFSQKLDRFRYRFLRKIVVKYLRRIFSVSNIRFVGIISEKFTTRTHRHRTDHGWLHCGARVAHRVARPH